MTNKRTKVVVKVLVEVSHTDKMGADSIEKLASESVHFSRISGASVSEGGYRTREIRRSSTIKGLTQND